MQRNCNSGYANCKELQGKSVEDWVTFMGKKYKREKSRGHIVSLLVQRCRDILGRCSLVRG